MVSCHSEAKMERWKYVLAFELQVSLPGNTKKCNPSPLCAGLGMEDSLEVFLCQALLTSSWRRTSKEHSNRWVDRIVTVTILGSDLDLLLPELVSLVSGPVPKFCPSQREQQDCGCGGVPCHSTLLGPTTPQPGLYCSLCNYSWCQELCIVGMLVIRLVANLEI